AKDPTRPPGRLAVASGAEPIAATYQVGSVIIGGGRKLAVVNGQRVMVGDQVDGAKVVGIKADTVVLHVEGEYKRYTINKPLKKKWLKRDKN
ncbi:MAG: general secretion pathway protein GspB, partial [Motiliproteus sp.]|nr:general secretion pathway protein GspB [Motiliproteus sp.]